MSAISQPRSRPRSTSGRSSLGDVRLFNSVNGRRAKHFCRSSCWRKKSTDFIRGPLAWTRPADRDSITAVPVLVIGFVEAGFWRIWVMRFARGGVAARWPPFCACADGPRAKRGPAHGMRSRTPRAGDCAVAREISTREPTGIAAVGSKKQIAVVKVSASWNQIRAEAGTEDISRVK